jgi:hypothetical protein
VSEEKQAVVDTTQAAAPPAVTDDSARVGVDPLDELLTQWDQNQAKQAPVSPPEVPSTQQPHQEVPPWAQELKDRLFQEDLNKAVSNIFGELKIPIPFDAQIGWIDQLARKNPALGRAFLNKINDPRAWEQAEKAVSKKIWNDFKSAQGVDEIATADHEAIAQSVRGASTNKVATEPAPKFGRMSNAEFRKKVIEEYGYDPGV